MTKFHKCHRNYDNLSSSKKWQNLCHVKSKSSKFMSEKKEKNEKVQHDSTIEETNSTEKESNSEKETETVKELTPEEKYAELNDKFLRLYSEFDNYRKRSNKEKVELISSASSGVLKELLPVLDDFERAIAVNENSDDVEGLKEGFFLIYSKLKSVLELKGLKVMESKGTIFDSELHEAIANVPVEDKKMIGKVIDDVEKGYFLNDKVIRYAKVVVGQ